MQLAPGEYGSPAAPLTGVMLSTKVVKIAPAVGAPRPHLHIGGTGYLSIYNGGTISDIDIDSTSTSSNGSLFGFLPVLRRITVRSKNNTACRLMHEATVENSVCATSAPGATGVAFSEAGTSSPIVNMRNVTAWSSAPNGTGMTFTATVTGVVTANITNTIARGSAADILVQSDGVGNSMAVSVVNSNFARGLTIGAGASLSSVNSNGNQSSAPALVDPGALDLREAIGSPTIDAGATAPSLDLFDAINRVRIQGGGTDIGAYEFSPEASALTALAITPAKFRAAKSGAMIAKKKKKPKGPVSGALTIGVNQTSQVNLTFERAKIGRKTAAGCKAKTKKNASKKKCTRYSQLPGITWVTVPTGSISVKISGRDAKKKKLAPGNYRVKAIPVAVGAAPGLPAYAKFSILP